VGIVLGNFSSMAVQFGPSRALQLTRSAASFWNKANSLMSTFGKPLACGISGGDRGSMVANSKCTAGANFFRR
jgi:hypothetical protein